MLGFWIWYKPILVYMFYMSKYVEFMDMVRVHYCVHGMLLHVKICRVHGHSMSQFFCTVFHMSKCVEFMDMVRPNFVMYIILHVKIIHEYGKIQFLCTCENILKLWDTIRFNSLCMCFTSQFFVYMFFVLVLPFGCFVLPRSLVLIWKPCIDSKEKF
jgi:hypothetical protein